MKTADILAFLYKPEIVEVWKMAEGGEKPDPDVLEERERTMRDSNLAYSLRANFTSLIRQLENRVREMETYLNQFLTIREILRVGMIDDPRGKIKMVLRYVLHRNERERESFMRYLIENNYITENDLQEFIHVPDVPEYRDLTAEDFNRPDIQRFVERELEVTTILDYLFERHLIDLEEYEEMEKANSRIEQVRILLAILQNRRDDSWTSKFCYILNRFGHQRILRGMQNIKSQHQIGIQESDIPVFGRTFKLETDHHTQLALREQSAADLNSQWQHEDHRITGTRPGCVEFMLLSGSEKACQILDTEDKEEKCRTFLQCLTSMPGVKATIKPGQLFKIKIQMFDSSLPLVAEENAKKLEYRLAIKICKSNLIVDLNVEVVIDIMVELNMIDHCTVTKLSATSDENLKKEYVIYLLCCCEEDKLKLVLTKAKESEQLKQFVDQIEQRRCIECYRKTLLTLYQEVEDEIDTEIMGKTLKGENDVPDLLTNVCIHKARNLSRADRAKIFLQYILTNENILLRFVDVFATMSKVVLTHTSCVYCTNNTNTSAVTDDTLAYTFVVEDANGEFLVKSTEKRKNDKFLEERQKSESFTDSEACIRVMMLGNSFACTSVWNLFLKESGSITADWSEKFLRHEEEFHGRRYLLNAVISHTSKDLEKGLTNYAELVSPGPHVIIIPITADNDPTEVLNEIIAVHGNDIENYILLVFLKPQNCSTSEEDDKIIHLCETDVKRRKTNFIYLNTRETNISSLKQTNDILEKMEEITIRNKLSCYSHKIFDQTEVIIQNAMKEKESRHHLESLQMKRRAIDEELKLIQEPQIPYRDQKLREQVVLKMLKRKSEGNENLQVSKHIGIQS